jgi:hypothetical protein
MISLPQLRLIQNVAASETPLSLSGLLSHFGLSLGKKTKRRNPFFSSLTSAKSAI